MTEDKYGEKIKITSNHFNYRKPFVNPNQPEFTELDFKIINRLFERLTLIFPAFKQAWPSQDDLDGSKKEWIRALKLATVFDVEKIKFGIGQFSLLPTPFVPSIGQFIQMCKKPNIPEYHKDYKRLSNTCTTKEVAISHLDKIKEMLKGKSTSQEIVDE